MSKLIPIFLLLLCAGCGKKELPYYERKTDWSVESNERYAGKHSPANDGNKGVIWHGYYFPNRVQRRNFANKYRLSVCMYDELVLGYHPGGIFGYDWPIKNCKESLKYYILRFEEEIRFEKEKLRRMK